MLLQLHSATQVAQLQYTPSLDTTSVQVVKDLIQWTDIGYYK